MAAQPDPGTMAFAVMAYWLGNKHLPLLQHTATVFGRQKFTAHLHLSNYNR